MTSAQIRQSYLDFFREKEHTIVSSSSLLPSSPGLLFTNAGMNQFVPIFLNETACPYHPARAADTQKCIRAGGKHNDLDDVGLDTYHHTFFEMLGNWSFGNYFKKEAIQWAWELVIGRWKFPANRIYATVYRPDKAKGDPAEFDQEAYDVWAELFTKAGLDPKVHIVNGNKKDNFWMMGETGPCGPCSEIHVDLTPEGDTKGSLVNSSDARCMEIWNLVFIQFNAGADGSFKPLPAQHVDTGMGFERVVSILQCTKNFTTFTGSISNYETDVFSPIFRELEKLSGNLYGSTLPQSGSTGDTDQEKRDVAFRVIADHIRTLSLSIADGIYPSNEGRNYVLRRILRRAVRYGRELGFRDLFFYRLVGVVCESMGQVFPELIKNQATIEKIIKAEEENFSRTLDRGIELYNKVIDKGVAPLFPGKDAFELYDTYGFPLDLTELMARERGLKVDVAAFDELMSEQRKRSQAAQKKEIIEVAENEEDVLPTEFVGFDTKEVQVQMASYKVVFGKQAEDTVRARLFFSPSPFYAEMGGQVGDTGWLEFGGKRIEILDTRKAGSGSIVHITEDIEFLEELSFPAIARLDLGRRGLIEGHHSATHLLHWALRQVLGETVSQKGSYVGPDRLRFDFSQLEAMKAEELSTVEKLVNDCISKSSAVAWSEQIYSEVKKDATIMQFFGDKYGERVRVVDIGGYSRELCGGTHVRNTSEIGLFRIISESAIASGVRRIEAVCGEAVNSHLTPVFIRQQEELAQLKLKSVQPLTLQDIAVDPAYSWTHYLKNQTQLAQWKAMQQLADKEEAKNQSARWQTQAITLLPDLISKAQSASILIEHLGEIDPQLMQFIALELKKQWKGVAVLGGTHQEKALLLALVTEGSTNAGHLIKAIAPLVGGKGGGKPDLAQGGGPEAKDVNKALAKAVELIV